MLWWTLRLLKSKNASIRIVAALKLGKSGNAKAVEPLIAALTGSNPLVFTFVAEALGKIGDARAIEPLSAALKDSNWFVRRTAAEALGKLKYEPTDQSQQALMFVALKKWDDAVTLGSAAIEPLSAALTDSHKQVRYTAAEALGAIGDARAVEPLSAALTDSDSLVRECTATALGKIGDARAVESLIVALEDSDKYVRKSAAEALIALKYEPADQVQQALMLIALRKWDDAVTLGSAAVEPLIATLKDSDEGVRYSVENALKALNNSNKG